MPSGKQNANVGEPPLETFRNTSSVSSLNIFALQNSTIFEFFSNQ